MMDVSAARPVRSSRMRILLAAAFLLAACSHRTVTTTGGQRDKIDGSEGAVCGWGNQHDGESLPEPDGCDPGLTCCYPCGIDGCDSVCEDVPHGDCPELP